MAKEQAWAVKRDLRPSSDQTCLPGSWLALFACHWQTAHYGLRLTFGFFFFFLRMVLKRPSCLVYYVFLLLENLGEIPLESLILGKSGFPHGVFSLIAKRI